MSKPPFVQQTAPERIWLTVSDDAHDAGKCFPDDHAEIYWSVDAPLDVCVPYVRADLVTSAPEASGADDYRTHHDDFRVACLVAQAHAPSDADRRYWQHQVDVLDRIKANPAPPTSGEVPEFVMCRCQDETARRLCADRGRCLRAVAQSATQPTPADE